MRHMRGRGLLVGGFVSCIALAAPAVLFASDEPDPAEPGSVTLEQAPIPDAPASAEVPAYGRAEDSGPGAGRRGTKAHSSSTFAVAMRDIEFRPGTIRIRPGDTVEWKNEDDVRHDAIGRNSSFDTPVINTDETSSHKFSKAGSYPYFCSIHQGMNGTVKVSSSSGGGGGSNGSGTGEVAGGTSTGFGTGSSFGSGSSSSLASTGQGLLWMALVGGALVWVGAALAVIVAQLRDQRRGTR